MEAMPMLLCALLAAVLSQAQADRTMTGQVVDDQGRPVPGARVFMHAPPLGGKEDTAQSEATTDAEGQFHLRIPPWGWRIVRGVGILPDLRRSVSSPGEQGSVA
jgi:hypothetical protein